MLCMSLSTLWSTPYYAESHPGIAINRLVDALGAGQTTGTTIPLGQSLWAGSVMIEQ